MAEPWQDEYVSQLKRERDAAVARAAALERALKEARIWLGGSIPIEMASTGDEARLNIARLCNRIDALATPAASPQRWGTHYETIPHDNCQMPDHCDCECPGCPGIRDEKARAATGDGGSDG